MVTSKRARRIYEFGPFQLDAAEQLLLCNGKSVPLTPKALATLLVLVENSGSLVEKEELLRRLWPDTFVEETTLARNISDLRKALGTVAGSGKYIETVPKRGYRFVAVVRELCREDTELIVVRATEAHLIIEEETLHQDEPEDELEAISLLTVPPTAQAIEMAVSEGTRPPLINKSLPAFAVHAIAPRRAAALTLLIIAALALALVIYLVKRANNSPAVFQRITVSKIVSLPGYTRAVISPDGKYVAYQIEEGAQQGLWVKYLPTASAVQVVASAHITGGVTFSPQGDYIFYIAREKKEQARTLYKAPILGGPAIQIQSGVDSPISFSPDGSHFAFVREYSAEQESALMIASADGSSERRLAMRHLPDFFDYPAWSPDGRVIACTAITYSDKFHANLVGIQVDSGAQQQIGNADWGYLFNLAWLHDGSGLVMSAKDTIANALQIWQLAYPSGVARRITNDLNNYLGVSMSADSNLIVTAQENKFLSLWVAPDRLAENARQVLPLAGKYSGVAWTPDGHIVYGCRAGDSDSVQVMAADGSEQKQLTSESEHAYSPTVSPDGRYILFVSDRGGNVGIWRMDIDGGHPEQLAGISNECPPQCSPDGKWVVYAAANASQWSALWKVPIEGGTPEQISEGFALCPAISPDGQFIACFYGDENASTQASPSHIAVLPLAGGPPVKRFNIPASVYCRAGICWTAAGNALTYVNTIGGVSNIWRQALDGSVPQPLTDFKGERIFSFDWSKNGEQLVCSRGTLNYDVILISNFR